MCALYTKYALMLSGKFCVWVT